MKYFLRSLLTIALVQCVLIGSTATAQRAIPTRQVTVVKSSDSTRLGSISGVRQLANGSVLVNDAQKRQLVLVDSELSAMKVLADTSSRPEYSYGLRAKAGALIPYVADSSLFADNETSILLVIDPHGAIVNVIAPVRAADLQYVSSGAYGASGFDPKGRMIYRAIRYFDEGSVLPNVGDKPLVVTWPDSAPILRTDFDARTVDTIAMIKVPVQKTVLTRPNGGNVATTTAFNPLPAGDEWTLLPDGTVAIVRAIDYHIDWLTPDGTVKATPKMPFDWKSISALEKQQLVDSVKRALDESTRRDLVENPPLPGAAPRVNFTVEAADIPDFFPALRSGEVRSDQLGNVWILPSTSAAAKGGLLYDVVNRSGEIAERVQLPAGRALVGFGSGDVVYLSRVLGPTRVALERAVIAR